VLKDCCKEKVVKLLGPIVNKNGHCYMECGNPMLIEKIERLWMIIHQKPHVLAKRVITLGMVRGIVCEEKGIPMTWAACAEWTNYEQFSQHQVKGVKLENRNMLLSKHEDASNNDIEDNIDLR